MTWIPAVFRGDALTNVRQARLSSQRVWLENAGGTKATGRSVGLKVQQVLS